ncbi:hypothetical protein [Microbacterium sp. Yaish 1]|uniref:hypothetical protein n=1 Tax=Microbacterium sp. Yaish 1 TaxID=2025014 RepID=UPI000B943E7A|nr:hypothetical protein [Microbacterium sp. Yaish 1]OYC97226.1 hypothetical protein CI089_01345 [Microbacterium sp. Yaish 1]
MTVDQQEIANLIAITSVPFLTIEQRRQAAERACALLNPTVPAALADDARRSAARRRFDLAAHALAAGVDVADRLATDPEYVADRSAWAQEQREQMRTADLQRYRDAEAALDASTGRSSEGA